MKEAAHKEKARAALSSVLWSLLLTGLKIWAGITTGSLGIISEALHSGLDFVAAAITFYAVRISAIPADEHHPYGHAKVENLSALAETLLLVLTCVWIFWEAIQRLFFNHVDIDLSVWAFVVVIISLVVDVNRSAMLRRVARKHKSQALEADALHFTTDIWSSAVVLMGLCAVWLARFVEPGTFLESILKKADAIAAMGVALIILFVAYGLSKRAIHTLMDGGSPELTQSVLQALREKAPWYPVRNIRVRDGGDHAYAELDVAVPKELPVDAAHDVTEQVEEIIKSVLPLATVTVHVDPQEVPVNTPGDLIVQYLALRHRIRAHGYMEVKLPEGPLVFMDVELPPDWSLTKASGMLEVFEKDVKRHLGMPRVALRIEPDKRELRAAENAPSLSSEEISQVVEQYCLQRQDIFLRSIDVEEAEGAPLVFVRAEVRREMSVLESYQLSEEIIWELKKSVPCVGKIIPLLEPSSEAPRQAGID